MLASANRLKAGREIARVQTKGRYAASDGFAVKMVRGGRAYSRAVVVVSKKVSKRATVRNRIRRRVAALLAGSWETVLPGYDIVVTVRDDVSELPQPDLARSLAKVLAKAGLVQS